MRYSRVAVGLWTRRILQTVGGRGSDLAFLSGYRFGRRGLGFTFIALRQACGNLNHPAIKEQAYKGACTICRNQGLYAVLQISGPA